MSRPVLAYFALLGCFLMVCGTARGQNFVQLWQAGIDNGNTGEFGQEQNGSTAAPGSPAVKDDDWYFAGIYPDPIGMVPANEPLENFERALLIVDTTNRIHFNLAEVHADANAELRLLIDVCCSNHGVDLGPGGPIPFSALFNGVSILDGMTSGTNDLEELFVSNPFTAASVGATTGENIVTIERPAGVGGNWMQFDYIRLEVDTDTLNCDEPICSFAADRVAIQAGEAVTLSWITRPGSTLTIDNGVGSVGGVTTGVFGSVEVFPTQNTTYTLTSVDGDEMEQASVAVMVDVIVSFTAAPLEVVAGNPVTLNWVTDPSAMVVIDQGVGPVAAGVGSLEVVPTELETTYTMTATRGPEVELAAVTVFSNPFTRLWTLGIDNGSQVEFGVEAGGSTPPPGSPFVTDDDWYFAGVYPDPIGIVPTDEVLENFERALLIGDPINRIHFNLDALQADPTNLFRVRIEVCCSDHGNMQGPEGPIDYSVLFNDILLLETSTSGVNGREELVFTPPFSGIDLNTVSGENIVTIQRKTNQGGNWMQFDLIALETMPGVPEVPFSIVSVEFNPGSGLLEITWNSRPGETYAVETSGNLETWDELTDNAESEGTTTSFSTVVDYAMFPELFTRVLRLGPP